MAFIEIDKEIAATWYGALLTLCVKSLGMGNVKSNSMGTPMQIWLVFDDNLSHVMRKPGFKSRSDTNQAVQPKKLARSLKFQI